MMPPAFTEVVSLLPIARINYSPECGSLPDSESPRLSVVLGLLKQGLTVDITLMISMLQFTVITNSAVFLRCVLLLFYF